MPLPKVALGLCGPVAVTLITFWFLAKKRVDIVSIHTEVEIDTAREKLWVVLSDFEGYQRWNPLMIEIQNPPKALRAGERLDWKSRIKDRVRNYNARIDLVAPNRELAWTGPISGMQKIFFWGEHRFVIEELATGRVRLVNKERFGGLLTLPLARYSRQDVRAAYVEANEALRKQAEVRDI